MKKRLLALVLVVALAISMTACNLFETNVEKDLARVVAKVSNGSYTDTVTKRELINTITSQGYDYLSSGQYTLAQLTEQFLDQLINRRIIVQEAALYVYKELSNDAALKAEFTSLGMTEGMTEPEILQQILAGENSVKLLEAMLKNYGHESDPDTFNAAINTAYNAVNDSVISAVDSYVSTVRDGWNVSADEEEDEEEDEVSDKTPRPTRTKETPEIEPVELTLPEGTEGKSTISDLKGYADDEAYLRAFPREIAVYTGYLEGKMLKREGDASDIAAKSVRLEGVTRLINNLKKQKNKEGKNYTFDSYYTEVLISQLESGLVLKYQELMDKSQTVTMQTLANRYSELYKGEKQKYDIDLSAYATALSSVGENTFVLYNPVSGYGYVKHILVMFGEEATAKLTQYNSSGYTRAQIEEERARLAASINVKDLREYQEKGKIVYTVSTTEGGTATEEEITIEYKQYDVISETLNKLVEARAELDKDTQYISKIVYTDSENEEASPSEFENYMTDEAFLAEIVKIFAVQTGDDAEAEDGFYQMLYETAATGSDSFYSYFQSVFGDAADAENDELFRSDLDSFQMIDTFTDWIFRYNEDDGMFNSATDYLTSPQGDIGSSETYVKEFAAGARAVVEAGVGAYTMVLTEFGYHLIICTESVKVDTNIDAETFAADEANIEIVEKLQNHETLTAEQKKTVAYKLYNLLLSENMNLKYNKEIYNAFEVYYAENESPKKVEKFEKVYEDYLKA